MIISTTGKLKEILLLIKYYNNLMPSYFNYIDIRFILLIIIITIDKMFLKKIFEQEKFFDPIPQRPTTPTILHY